MANPPTNQAPRRAPVSKAAQTAALRKIVIIVCVGIAMVAALPTVVIVVVGMVPTLVSYIIDLTPGRYACRCVSGLNVAGVAPSVLALWSGGNDMTVALTIIADSLAWLAFYGSAAFGWMLFLSLPGAVSAVQTLNGRRHVNALRARQKELVHEWGKSITGEEVFDGTVDGAETAPGVGAKSARAAAS